MSKVLSVKISSENNQIRRFTIPLEGTAQSQYDALQRVLKENYSAPLKAGAQLKFADDEGDLCVLTSVAEWSEAVRLLGNPPATLKLTLVPAPAPAPASAAAPAQPAAKPVSYSAAVGAKPTVTPVVAAATTAVKPAAATSPAAAKPLYPALPAKPAAAAAPAVAVKPNGPAPAAAPAVASPAKPSGPAPAAAPKVEAVAAKAPAAKSSPVAATASAATAAAKKVESPKDTAAAAAPKATDAKADPKADAKKEETAEDKERASRHSFRDSLRALLFNEKTREALKALVPAGVAAVKAIASGEEKRSFAAVVQALVASNAVLNADAFVTKELLPRLSARMEHVEPVARAFLPAAIPFLPLVEAHLPAQIDRLAERLAERHAIRESWKEARANGTAGKGTECPNKAAFCEAMGFDKSCGGLRGGAGPCGLLRALFGGAREAAAGEGEELPLPEELKDLCRLFRGGGGCRRFFGGDNAGGCHRFRCHRKGDRKEESAAAGSGTAAAAPSSDNADAPSKTADGKEIHYHVSCDGCNAKPLTGVRYKCQVCRNFDLCETCEAAGKHPADHALLKIRISQFGADGRRNRSRSRDAKAAAAEEEAAKGPAIHAGITCDGCNVSPIVDVRYKCQTCPDFDLCSKCEEAGKHSEHTFLKMKSSETAPGRGRGGWFRHHHHHPHGHHGHGPHGHPHPHPHPFPFGPFGPHGHGPFGGRGFWRRHCRGNTSGSDSESASEGEQKRAQAAAFADAVSDIVRANPFLASAIEGVEVRNAAPDAADPNTASAPLDFSAGPAAFLRAMMPAVFGKAAAKPSSPTEKAKTEQTAAAGTATAATDAPAPAAKDEKGEPVAVAAAAAVAPVKPASPAAAAPKKSAAETRADADVAALKAMGFDGHPEDVLRTLLRVADVKKHRRNTAVQWVVDALLSGEAEKYIN